MGIGMAIPINLAKSVYEQLLDTGTVVRGFLGVGPRDITPEMADHCGLDSTEGVIVAEVVADSAAEEAGI